MTHLPVTYGPLELTVISCSPYALFYGANKLLLSIVSNGISGLKTLSAVVKVQYLWAGY